MFKAKEVAICGMFAALTAASAQIAIPIGPVPFTLQVLAVILTGFLLGPYLGFWAQLIYLLVGALGLPVFAGLRGGMAHLYGPTGGYLVAFPISALVVGWVSQRFKGFAGYFFASVLGIAVIYLLGWMRLAVYMGGNLSKAFAMGVAPFILVDLIKALVCSVVAERLEKVPGLSSLKGEGWGQ